jgi:hypothetical protein
LPRYGKRHLHSHFSGTLISDRLLQRGCFYWLSRLSQAKGALPDLRAPHITLTFQLSRSSDIPSPSTLLVCLTAYCIHVHAYT